MPGEEIIDPMAYDGWWTLVGVALLVLALLVVVAGALLTRTRTEAPAEGEPPAEPADPLVVLRNETVRRLDDLGRRRRTDEIDDRAFYLELRAELRTFAQARTGRNVRSSTVTMLAASPETRRLATELEHTLAPAFGPDARRGSWHSGARADNQAKEALRRARRLVLRW
ncbi:hypothetical protein [Nocardioides limicola]|uniref:hypothetical protein n=1 Tax=Nocardioides limicola TaxID=2803368 RepID=UPI00193C3AFD|nr:hypothetical protein [Nocardioides sp. DJM-14]